MFVRMHEWWNALWLKCLLKPHSYIALEQIAALRLPGMSIASKPSFRKLFTMWSISAHRSADYFLCEISPPLISFMNWNALGFCRELVAVRAGFNFCASCKFADLHLEISRNVMYFSDNVRSFTFIRSKNSHSESLVAKKLSACIIKPT